MDLPPPSQYLSILQYLRSHRSRSQRSHPQRAPIPRLKPSACNRFPPVFPPSKKEMAHAGKYLLFVFYFLFFLNSFLLYLHPHLTSFINQFTPPLPISTSPSIHTYQPSILTLLTTHPKQSHGLPGCAPHTPTSQTRLAAPLTHSLPHR